MFLLKIKLIYNFNMERKAILIIDMLNDFIDNNKDTKAIKKIIDNIKSLINYSRKNNHLIIYVNDAHIENEDEELKEWGNHAIKGTKGAKVIKELKPLQNDLIIEKRAFSGFNNTNLNNILLKENIKEIVLCGVFADICLKETCVDALDNNYKVYFVKDCTKNYYNKTIDETICELKEVGNIIDINLQGFVKENK